MNRLSTHPTLADRHPVLTSGSRRACVVLLTAASLTSLGAGAEAQAAAKTTRVSVDSARNQSGPAGSGSYAASHDAVLASDGRFVAFLSYADNLVQGDTNRMSDVFVHDRLFDPGVSADLSLAASSRTDPGSSRDGRTFTLVAANHGPGSAAEAALTVSLAANKNVVSVASSSEGGCNQGPVLIVCRLGTLSPGGSAAVSLTLESKRAGGASPGSAEVSAAPRDPNSRNNRTTLKDKTSRSL